MKRLYILLTAMMAAMTASAQNVSLQRAKQMARPFGETREVAYTMRSSTEKDKTLLYVLNVQKKNKDGGFVIVSGRDDDDAEVLGWCDHGQFDYESAPPLLKAMLKNYALGMEKDKVKTRSVRKADDSAPMEVVKPLLKTTWSQWTPYNDFCPKGCPSGCTITAVAQVMNYWKWPDVGFGTHYHGREDVTIDYSKSHYDWASMADNYSVRGNTSAEQNAAVAKLMYEVGIAYDAIYNTNGTSASLMGSPLIEHFRYSTEIKSVSVNIENNVKSELNNRRPVLYAGFAPAASSVEEPVGHSLVCDGYNSANYFHFNYGWGGSYDGYYKLGELHKYNDDAHVLIGIQPDKSMQFLKDDMVYAILPGDEVELRKCSLTEGDVTILDNVTYEGVTYPIVRIAKNAFPANKTFGTITIGNNVREIGPAAFIACQINTVVIGDKVEDIGDEAFSASNVKTLTLGRSVRRVGKKAFMTCPLNTVTCLSDELAIDDYGFYFTKIKEAEWFKNITSLGECALAATNVKNPVFEKLEKVGSQAFASLSLSDIKFSKKLRQISPDAFWGSVTYGVTIDKDNPWLCTADMGTIILNKNKTCLIMTVPSPMNYYSATLPDGVVKLNKNSVTRSVKSIGIPPSAIEMDGAFDQCESLSGITCYGSEPPVLTDASFPDKIFKNNPFLYVPSDAGDAYRNAPGWRRFVPYMFHDDLTPVPTAETPMNMVVHQQAGEGLNVAVKDVKTMNITDRTFSVDGWTTNIENIDSITWSRDFQYDQEEVFELNDSVLTAQAQGCTVTLDAAVLDDDATLTVRSTLYSPAKVPGATGCGAVDITLIDSKGNTLHNLSGTAEIRIPLQLEKDQAAGAVWYNTETGQWDPANGVYDEQAREMVISTNHLSTFEAITIDNRYSRTAKLVRGWIPDNDKSLSEVARNMHNIVSDTHPLTAAGDFYASDVSTFTQLGNDFTFNALQSVGLDSEALSDFSKNLGYFGTMWSIYQVARASYDNNDEQVAGGTLKLIVGKATEIAGDLLSSNIWSASMASVAFIDYAINKFAEEAWSGRKDIYKAAFNLYYSKRGRAIVNPAPGKGFKSGPDWFNLFYPIIQNTALDEIGLQKVIDDYVRKYCREYWEDEDAQSLCMTEAHNMGWSYGGGLNQKIMDELSEELRGNLYNGVLVSVFQSIKKHRENDAYDKASQYFDDYLNYMNRVVQIKITDSALKDGKSEYAGHKVRFAEVPGCIIDPELWECTLDEKGEGKILYRLFAYLDAGFQPNLVLVNPKGEELTSYAFTMEKSGKNLAVKIDLQNGGVEVPARDAWRFGINPEWAIDAKGKELQRIDAEEAAEGIKQALAQNRNLVLDANGAFTIEEEGVKISGTIDRKSQTGSGTFSVTARTDYSNTWSEEKMFDFFAAVTMHQTPDSIPQNVFKTYTANHKISGTVTISYSEKAQKYVLRLQGEGDFSLSGDYYVNADPSIWIWNEDYTKIIGYKEKVLQTERGSISNGKITIDSELLY